MKGILRSTVIKHYLSCVPVSLVFTLSPAGLREHTKTQTANHLLFSFINKSSIIHRCQCWHTKTCLPRLLCAAGILHVPLLMNGQMLEPYEGERN